MSKERGVRSQECSRSVLRCPEKTESERRQAGGVNGESKARRVAHSSRLTPYVSRLTTNNTQSKTK